VPKRNKIDNNQLDIIASRLAELGHPTRLSIFKQLVKSGTNGIPVGQIQDELGIPASTLSHHLAKLVNVGLMKQRRESRTLFCVPKFDALVEVIDFLNAECCIEQSDIQVKDS